MAEPRMKAAVGLTGWFEGDLPRARWLPGTLSAATKRGEAHRAAVALSRPAGAGTPNHRGDQAISSAAGGRDRQANVSTLTDRGCRAIFSAAKDRDSTRTLFTSSSHLIRRIGIGGDGSIHRPPRPSHTTGRTGPYPAVRKVEVSWQVEGPPGRRSMRPAARFGAREGWTVATSGPRGTRHAQR
jgi:hypothetical protein